MQKPNLVCKNCRGSMQPVEMQFVDKTNNSASEHYSEAKLILFRAYLLLVIQDLYYPQ